MDVENYDVGYPKVLLTYLLVLYTENGISQDHNLGAANHDENRRQSFEGYIRACGETIDVDGGSARRILCLITIGQH